jgi:hypothetical protein
MTQPATAGGRYNIVRAPLVPFEILNRAFVFLRRRLAVEGAEISSFADPRIFLARVEPILAGFQFPNHAKVISNYSPWSAG